MEKAASPHAKLDVWQKSMDLVASVYLATKSFPKEELYTPTSQIRRAAISIPSNIAEGRAKRTTREFMCYTNIASGSAAKLETQIMIGKRLGYMSSEQTQLLLTEITSIGRMLNKLYSSLEDKLPPTSDLQPLTSSLREQHETQSAYQRRSLSRCCENFSGTRIGCRTENRPETG